MLQAMINKGTDPVLEPALRDVDSIQNLDTARLALRWSLERMRTLEKHADELEAAAKLSAASREKTSSELEGTQDLLSRRTNEALERERYYSKIEEYLNLKLEGGLDATALAAREVRIEARETELQKREVETAEQIQAANKRADAEIRRIQAETAAADAIRAKSSRDEFDQRGAARDREQSERLLAIHEKEAQLSSLERSLEERRKRFVEFFAAQRAALQRESAEINQAAADQADFLERRVEAALAAKTAAAERAWQADKRILMDEISTWRAKAREHFPALIEAQHKAADVEAQNARLADEIRVLAQARADLTKELERWRQESHREMPALLTALATERRALVAEEKAAKLEVALSLTQRHAEEAQAQLMSNEMTREARLADFAALEAALGAKLREAEADLFRQYDAWLERETFLRRRDQDWRYEAQARRESVGTLYAEISAQRDELKRAIAAYRQKAAALGRGDVNTTTGEPK